MANRTLKIFSIATAEEAFANLKLAQKKAKLAPQGGIVHPAGHEGAAVERSAVARALQEEATALGVPYHSGPQGDLHRDIEKYTGALRKIVNSKAAGHPTVQSYIQTAKRLIAPTEGGKNEAGRQELHNTTTQPTVAELAGLLRKKGLLQVADRLLARDPEHVPFENYVGKLKTKQPAKSGFVDLTGSGSNHEPTPLELEKHLGELGPTIKPATDETVTPPDAHYMSVRKANRDRDREEADTPLTIASDDTPLSLADPGIADGDTKYHDIISPMVFQKKPVGEIVKQVAKVAGISDGAARKQVKKWIEAKRSGHVKLARERQGQVNPDKQVQLRDLSGGVDPHIAGTRLAMHLIGLAKEFAPGSMGAADNSQGTKIHHLAKAALAGKGMKGVPDVYAALGEALSSVPGHPLQDAYNWHSMSRSMGDDAVVKEFLEKFRKPGMSDKDFYSQVVSRYAPGSKHHSSVHNDQFWKMIGDHFTSHVHGMNEDGSPGRFTDDKRSRIVNSLYRLHTLADDRETAANVNTKLRSKQFTDGQGMPLGDWRKHFSHQWANEHMRFNRRPGAKVKLARPEEYSHLTKAVADNRGEVTARKALADYLQENDIPGAHIVNHNEIPHEDGKLDGQVAPKYLGKISSHTGLYRDTDRSHILALNHAGNWWANPEDGTANGRIPADTPLMDARSNAATPAEFEKEMGDVPLAQLIFPEARRSGKVALYMMHNNPHGQRFFHAVTLDSGEKLKQMTADWPEAAKQKLLHEIKRLKLNRFFKKKKAATNADSKAESTV